MRQVHVEDLLDYIDEHEGEEGASLYLQKEFQAVSYCLSLAGVSIGNKLKHAQTFNAGVITSTVLKDPHTKQNVSLGSYEVFHASYKQLLANQQSLSQITTEQLKQVVSPQYKLFSGASPYIYHSVADLELVYPMVIKTAAFYLAAIAQKSAVLSYVCG